MSKAGAVWFLMFGILVTVLGCSQQQTLSTQNGGSTAYGPASAIQRTSDGATEAKVDLKKLAEQSRRLSKAIYIEFTAPWCPNCVEYEQNTLSTPEGRRELARVIYVSANYDVNRSLADSYKFPGIPAGILLKARQDGTLRLIAKHIGGLDLAELKAFLDQGD